VQIFLWYHVVPALIPPLRGVPSFILVVLGLGLFTSARISEQVKAGIQSLPRGQRMAGWRSASPCRRPTATSSCRWPSASSSRRSPASR
jgi:ABC-type amino acid transport system permease subunit